MKCAVEFPRVARLNDGRFITLFSPLDLTRTIGDYMGYEVSDVLTSTIDSLEKQADYNEKKLDSDLTSYEMSMENYHGTLLEIREILEGMMAQYAAETGRNRRAALFPWAQKIQEVMRLIDNNT